MTIPTDIRKALAADLPTKKRWDDLTPIGRRDFISWIESAKLPETRRRRIDSLGSRLASGKRRPCCYAVVPMGLYRALSGNAKAKGFWKGLSPDEKRDFSEWVESAKDSATRVLRTEKAVAMLAAGKRRS